MLNARGATAEAEPLEVSLLANALRHERADLGDALKRSKAKRNAIALGRSSNGRIVRQSAGGQSCGDWENRGVD